MRAGNGTESSEHRGDGKARRDGLHSVDGGGNVYGSIAQAEGISTRTRGADRGNDGGVPQAPWFAPVEDEEVSDCPGGVCPVPWDTIQRRPVVQEDLVNHPSHYTDGGIECIEAIEAQLSLEEYRGFLKGNCAKYIWREKHKGGIESLKKARWYLDRLIEMDEV
jgi:hypothetical protein